MKKKGSVKPTHLVRKRNFETVLLDAIDEGLVELGESIKTTIYFHLEKNYYLKRNLIPQNLDGFSVSMQKIFGSGESVIENLIMRKLCESLNVSYRGVEGRGFQAAVEEIRTRAPVLMVKIAGYVKA